MKPQKILLIINPVSGRMKSKTGLFEILDELYRNDPPAHPSPAGDLSSTTPSGSPLSSRQVIVCPTMYRGHAKQLAASATEVDVDTVICCGGDGTLNETISGLMTIPTDRRPPLGYIPAGSTNDFAISIGLPSTLRGAARQTVSDAEAPVDIGYFRPIGQDALPSRYFSYIASFGLFTATSYSTPQNFKNVLGHVAYLLEGVKDLANIQPHHASFVLDDHTHIEGDYIFGAVTNTTSAGGVFKLPAGSVSMSDGELEVFLVHHPRTVVELNKIITALVSADFDGCPFIEFHHAGKVEIALAKPLSWSLDGEEAIGGTRVQIECKAGAVSLKGAKT